MKQKTREAPTRVTVREHSLPLVPIPRRSYNILVVEDNPGDAHLIREAFRECGHDCTLFVAETVDAAKELLKQQSFDLILSDMGAQDGEGAELLREIRSDERLKIIPVVVLSGMPNPRSAYEAGANAFIAKTMNMDQFFAKIQALMHFWVDVAELPSRSGNWL